jgi:hypothetical protein
MRVTVVVGVSMRMGMLVVSIGKVLVAWARGVLVRPTMRVCVAQGAMTMQLALDELIGD